MANDSSMKEIDRKLLGDCDRFAIERVRYWLTAGANPNACDDDGVNGLMIAAKNDDIAMMNLLLSYGACPQHTDWRGRNLLHWAIELGDGRAARYCLLIGLVDPNDPDHNGLTPIAIAVLRNWWSMVDFLVQQGADPYRRDANGRDLLDLAITLGWAKTVSRLIVKYGFDVNRQDGFGNTPLMTAIRNRKIEMSRALLAHGANPLIRNRSGHNAKIMAEVYGIHDAIFARAPVVRLR